MSHPWLLAAWLASALLGLWAAPEGVRVPAATIELGSTVDELIEAANFCNRLTGRPTCRPEDFALERIDRKASIATFVIDRTEVSVGEYERCQVAGACLPHRMPPVLLDVPAPQAVPVTMVNLEQAEAYCAFRGARLPTEAEFELAARGPRGRNYPWGNLFHAGRVNGGRAEPEATDGRDGFELLAPVDALHAGRTPLGILQLSGNVAEWTSSWQLDPAGARTGSVMVRGGHFASPPWHQRAAHRESVHPLEKRPTLGFRCARSGPTAL